MKVTVLLVSVFVLLLTSIGFADNVPALNELKYPKLNKLEVPEVSRVTLDNGLRLYLIEDHQLPIFRMAVNIGAGSYLEPAEKIGLVSVMGEVLRTGGTEKWTGDELDELLEGIGGSVETSGGTTECNAGVRVLAEYRDLGLEVLAEILRRPVFDEDKIELSRVGHRSAISRRNDEPFGVAIREFQKLLYGAQSPYARQIEYATLDALDRNDLVAFHGSYFKPENIQMAIWGDFKESEIVTRIKQLFGNWERGAAPVPPPPTVDYQFAQKVYLINKTDVNQSQVLIGHIGGLLTDSDYADRIVMNTIMGGGFGSRMTDAVRSREGLAYTAQSSYTADLPQPGIFYNYAATKSESTGKAIREMIKVVESMQTEPPTEQELAQGKDSYLNSFVFNFDTRSEVVNRMMQYELNGLPADFLQQVKERIENVTADDIVAAAKHNLHPEALVYLVVGKADDFDLPLDSLGLGPVETIDITIPSGEKKAEVTVTAETLQKGAELLTAATAAHGGLDNFARIRTLSYKGTLTLVMGGREMPLQIESIRILPDKIRTVVSFMGRQIYDISDGVGGWKTDQRNGAIVPKTEEDLAEDARDRRRGLTSLFGSAEHSDFQAVYSGPETLDGVAAEVITLLGTDGEPFCSLTLDAASHRLLQETYWGETPAGEGLITERYLEWTEMAGVELPSRVSRSINGQVFRTDAYSELLVNPDVPEGSFDQPE